MRTQKKMKENYYGNVNVKLLHKFKAICPLYSPVNTPPLFSLTADAYAPHFECGVHFGPARIPNTIEFHVWHDHTRPRLPPSSTSILLPRLQSVQKFSLFCFGFAIRQAAGEKYLMRFPLASIHTNLRSKNWNLGKYPPRLRLLLAHNSKAVEGMAWQGMAQVQGRGSFGLEGICLCQIFAYKLIQKRARVLNRAQIALLNTRTHTPSNT